MRNLLKTNDIQELARFFLGDLNLKPGFDMELLVKKLGGSIKLTPQNTFSKVEKFKDGFVISVSSSYDVKRRRFLVAHEIGHLFIHMHFLNQNVWLNLKSCSSQVYAFGHDQQELEANEFASEFLMPEKVFKEMALKFAKENYEDLIANLSNYFKVSEVAILYRGHNLKLWVKNKY